ncbi:DUF3667 domain-containing protein [Nonlabens xiamenensis]|uniref:DUF3667 domain-containing protein n=1 Tax=Nonlabens xiamenensis TaxID=2341043 RepID=UPI0013DDF9B7|nr:DUF3667 domain-containing protein [Nonlabens xiamenensis]
MSVTAEFSERYLGTDNVFLKTLVDLFIRPHKVINGYINGQRKTYVNPASFYFISLTLIGLQVFLLKRFFPELLGLNGLSDQKNIFQLMNFFYDYMGLLTSIFIPAYALTGWIVFLDIKKFNFAEHIVFYIYVLGWFNIVIAISTPLIMLFNIPYSFMSFLISLFSVVMIAWSYKACFQLNFGQTLLKTLFAILLYGVVQLIFILIIISIVMAGLYFFSPETLTDFKIFTSGT